MTSHALSQSQPTGRFTKRSTGRSPAYKPGSVDAFTHVRARTSDGHSSRRSVTRTLQQPTRGSTSCDALSRRAVSHRLFGLAPAGVCLAANVATDAVGSYPTVSPLPLLSQRRFVFCCTVRHMKLTPHVPRRYLATCPMEPGLSSAYPACTEHIATVRPTTSRTREYSGALVLTEIVATRYRTTQSCDAAMTTWPRLATRS